MRTTKSVAALLCVTLHAENLGLRNERRYDQQAYLESHNAYANPEQHYTRWVGANQDRGINDQLDAGVRSLDLRLWKVQQKQVGCNPQALIYDDKDEITPTISRDLVGFDDAPLQVVLGHHLTDSLWALIDGAGVNCSNPYFYEDFTERMKTTRQWLDDHKGEVVTVNAFNESANMSSMVRQSLDTAGIRAFVPTPDIVNEGMTPAHAGMRKGGLRPIPDGWWVPMDGYPTLQQLIDGNRRLVWLGSGGVYGSYGSGDIIAGSTYGWDSITHGCLGEHSDNWTDVNPDTSSVKIDDFTRPLFLMQHVNTTPQPTHEQTKCAQDKGWLDDHLNDMVTRWNRLPNFLRVDHAVKDTALGGASNHFDGPKEFIQALNDRWAAHPTITPVPTSFSGPNAAGWANADVTISGMWGSGDTIRQVIYSVFSGYQAGSLLPEIVVDRKVETSAATYTLSTEGRNVVTFYTVGQEGNTSEVTYFDVWIDKTPPSIAGQVGKPNARKWYNQDVTATFTSSDFPSGIDPDPAKTTPSITLSTEGADQTIEGRATDLAGNVATAKLSGINVDKTPPVVTYSGNHATYTADETVKITCTATDTLSGILSTTCKDIEGPAYGFTKGAEATQANVYTAAAVDNADNSANASTSFHVISTFPSQQALTRRFVHNTEVLASLLQKLELASQASARGDKAAQAQWMNAYRKEVADNAGSIISLADSNTLACTSELLLQ